MSETDYIVVGAGSAGSALAYRLAEAGKDRITVVEHGGSDWGPFIQMPSALSYPMNMRLYDWGFNTEPEPHLGGRRLATPRPLEGILGKGPLGVDLFFTISGFLITTLLLLEFETDGRNRRRFSNNFLAFAHALR